MTKKHKVFPSVQLSNGLEQDKILSDLRTRYKSSADAEEADCYNLTTSPFKVCTLLNVLKEDIAVGLLNEIQEMEFTFKENDLLSLHQTVDLNDVKSPYISAVQEFIYTELKAMIATVTNSSFNSTVDLHGIKFMQHDNLLCHSDCLNTRHTAFILYLVPKTWSPDSGGTLDLFNSDENDEPTDIGRSLCPQFNSFSWFRVSNRSWHQVSEVLEDDIRWSISGWFHSDNAPLVHPMCDDEFTLNLTAPIEGDLDILKSWISLKYLNLEISSEVQQQFQEDSEVSLGEFLNPDKYSALRAELACTEWTMAGPTNRRRYKVADTPHNVLGEFIELLKSDAFAVLLSHVTGLPLSVNYDDPDCHDFVDKPFGMMGSCISRWERGFYSMLCDQDVANLPDTLHIFYHADLYPEYDVDAGGYISFVSHSDEEPLLVVPPQNNTLSLVFTRPDEFGFTKYINSKLEKPYYCIRAQYVARTPNEEPKNHAGTSDYDDVDE